MQIKEFDVLLLKSLVLQTDNFKPISSFIAARPMDSANVKNLEQLDMCYYSTLPEILYDTVVERN